MPIWQTRKLPWSGLHRKSAGPVRDIINVLTCTAISGENRGVFGWHNFFGYGIRWS